MAHRHSTLEDYERRLLRAQALIQENLDQPLTPTELAAAAHFSLHHFHRIFRAQIGETVMQHIRRLRLERAARKMRGSGLRLIDLALEAGYDSHEAFTRAFIARFGVAPSEYREQPSARLAGWARERPAATVAVRDCPAIRVAFMRHHGGYLSVGATGQGMRDWLERRGLRAPMYGVCPDDPDVTEEARLRFDACAAVEPTFTADGAVGTGEIPAGSYAVGVHVGPYERLHETYLDIIGRWFPTSGYELAPEPVVEHYLNDPSCAAANDLQTEVRVRIADGVQLIPTRMSASTHCGVPPGR